MALLPMNIGTNFILSLPNIDTITTKVRKNGKGSLPFKIDISRAFRHVKIDPREYPLLDLSLDKYYFDTCVPFDYRHGPAIFQRLTDAIRYIMASRGISITNYIDNLIGSVMPSKANAAFDQLHSLLQELGFDKKLVRPSTTCVCLGTKINTEKCTVAIPQDKLKESQNLCKVWHNKASCTKQE